MPLWQSVGGGSAQNDSASHDSVVVTTMTISSTNTSVTVPGMLTLAGSDARGQFDWAAGGRQHRKPHSSDSLVLCT
eukprot:1312578-Amphidinium_carterae.2